MFTRPEDLSDDDVRDALAAGWRFDASDLAYAPVGFGCHHWLARDGAGDGRFVTVHDLPAKRRDGEPPDDVFARLRRAITVAHALHHDGGLPFVVPPITTIDGAVVRRLDDRYSIMLNPLVEGRPSGTYGAFESEADRRTVLDLLVEVHGRTDVAAEHADREDGAMPNGTDVTMALETMDEPWDAGPYGERARALLRAHADDLAAVLPWFRELAHDVLGHSARMVVTHGEPHASNVMISAGAHLLIDWDTALLAPPERDLWVIDAGDGATVDAYARRTGTTIVPEALAYYRLWYDLMEIGGYLALFRAPHGETADAAESWTNLQEFLQPRARWPQRF